nr:hypothetical protein [Tanacetum cinerariifolium]
TTTTTTTLPPPQAPQQKTTEDMMLFEALEKSMNRDHSEELAHDLAEAWKKRKRESALASNYSPPPEDSLLAQTGDIATFIDWFCKRRGITELKPQDLEGPAYEIVKVFHPDVIYLQYQMEECHKLLTDSVDYPILRHNVSKPLPLGVHLVKSQSNPTSSSTKIWNI